MAGKAFIYEFNLTSLQFDLLLEVPAPPGASRFGTTVVLAAPLLLVSAPGQQQDEDSEGGLVDVASAACGTVYYVGLDRSTFPRVS